MSELLTGVVIGFAVLPLMRLAVSVALTLFGHDYSPWSQEHACLLCSHKAARHGGTAPPADPATGVRPYEDVFGACGDCGCSAMTPRLRFYPNRAPELLLSSAPDDAR